MTKSDELFNALRETTRDTGFAFMRIELQVANTMLNITLHDADATRVDRRRVRAIEARDEVARHADDVWFTEAQRAELRDGLARLDARLKE